MSDETAMLRECADALDADRGHNASAVTRRIREAADHLDALRADREEHEQNFALHVREATADARAERDEVRNRLAAAEADREALREALQRIENRYRDYPLIGSSVDMHRIAKEALARLSSANQETP